MSSSFQFIIIFNLGNLAIILIGIFKISKIEIKLDGAILLKKITEPIIIANGLIKVPIIVVNFSLQVKSFNLPISPESLAR